MRQPDKLPMHPRAWGRGPRPGDAWAAYRVAAWAAWHSPGAQPTIFGVAIRDIFFDAAAAYLVILDELLLQLSKPAFVTLSLCLADVHIFGSMGAPQKQCQCKRLQRHQLSQSFAWSMALRTGLL